MYDKCEMQKLESNNSHVPVFNDLKCAFLVPNLNHLCGIVVIVVRTKMALSLKILYASDFVCAKLCMYGSVDLRYQSFLQRVHVS